MSARFRRLRLGLAVSAVATVLALVAVVPGSAQDTSDPLAPIEGLDPLDPVLNEVANVINTIASTVSDLLVDVPLVNTLALGGDDAISAAVALSQATFPDGAGTAIISRDDLFADGFSSGAFQGVFEAPLLFTGSEDLDVRTGQELRRLGMSNVAILGGERALNPLVVSKLEAAGLNVSRVGGPTRVETAIEAAQVTAPSATTAVLVRAYPDAGQGDDQAYADLLAAGPYAAENGWPLLLTTSGSLHPAVAAYLAEAGFTDVVIVGGEQAVSAAVEQAVQALGISTGRVAGSNRFATAVAIAEARGFATSADADRLIVAESGARDDVWAPGFAASAHGEQHRAPILLADGALLPPETLEFVLAGMAENLLDGGPAAICAPFVNRVACQALGLLLLGDLTEALDLLGLDLSDLPLLDVVLGALADAGLLSAEEIATIYELLGGELPDGTPLEGVIGELDDTTDPIDDVTDPVDDVVDDITDPLDDVTGDLLGG